MISWFRPNGWPVFDLLLVSLRPSQNWWHSSTKLEAAGEKHCQLGAEQQISMRYDFASRVDKFRDWLPFAWPGTLKGHHCCAKISKSNQHETQSGIPNNGSMAKSDGGVRRKLVEARQSRLIGFSRWKRERLPPGYKGTTLEMMYGLALLRTTTEVP